RFFPSTKEVKRQPRLYNDAISPGGGTLFNNHKWYSFKLPLTARHIPAWRKDGFTVKLFFLSLASPEMACARVAQRVKVGGHNAPEATIRRRFAAGLRNFEEIYKPLVNKWALYDNSFATPILIGEGENP
ncbi:MAG: hypothetical protein KA113_13060, partial [Syntrophaceae bacterium]|nr:hypothetical protein [Syntrophaceae bacterium]